MDDGLALLIGEDFEVEPGKLGAKAQTEGFSNRLFCGKATGQAGIGILAGKTVALLALRKEPL